MRSTNSISDSDLLIIVATEDSASGFFLRVVSSLMLALPTLHEVSVRVDEDSTCLWSVWVVHSVCADESSSLWSLSATLLWISIGFLQA